MPIYEYQCQQCGHELEALQKISDPPLTDCPKCQAPALQKLVSAASFRLKGGGWYETDFKSGDKKHLAEPESGKSKEAKESESKAGDDKGTDSKKETGSKQEGTEKKPTAKSSSTESSSGSKSISKPDAAAG